MAMHQYTSTSALPSAPMSSMMDDTPLNCQAVVLRMGEIFGEFGFRPAQDTAQKSLQGADLLHMDGLKWQLIVYARSNPREALPDTCHIADESPSDAAHLVVNGHGQAAAEGDGPEDGWTAAGASEGECPAAVTGPVVLNTVLKAGLMKKVVKLLPGHRYGAVVRLYDRKTLLWGPWSSPVHTATLHPVAAEIAQIGEDYVRLQWDRRPRDTDDCAPELHAEGMGWETHIDNLEFRLIRKDDMEEVFNEGMSSGARAYTVHNLRPGTGYIVLMRYETLIGTMRVWAEVGRFYTGCALVVQLETCGEEVCTVCWTRDALPKDTIGYILPTTQYHMYELHTEVKGVQFDPVQLPASTTRCRITDLLPGAEYTVHVRSMTEDGLWGGASNLLAIRTAAQPHISLTAVGESFVSFTWTREVEKPDSSVEYRLLSLSSDYRQQDVVPLEGGVRMAHVSCLFPGTDYVLSIRTCIDGEWGRWTESVRVSTLQKPVLTFRERGEDFVLLEWPHVNSEHLHGTANTDDVPLHVVVRQISNSSEGTVILDEELVPRKDQPGFRISQLQTDGIYEVTCRLWQRNVVSGWEGWGAFSAPLRVQTLQPVALHVWDLGEDSAHIAWRRGLSCEAGLGAADRDVNVDNLGEDLKYEVVVRCVDSDDQVIVHREVLQTSYAVTNLMPATTYSLSVRACDEHDQWGLWSTVRVRTLAAIVATIHEIAEDFVRLTWQRTADDASENHPANMGKTLPTDSLTTADAFVSQYSVLVYAKEPLEAEVVPHEASGYSAGGRSDVVRHEHVSSDHTSLRVGELLPDREYVAVVRASTATGRWGLWSTPVRFRTNPQFSIPVQHLNVGENYVSLLWTRDVQPITDKEVQLGDMTVTGQQLRIQGVDTPYSNDHTLQADLRELKLYGLSPATAYAIQLRVRGRSGCWGLWSPPVRVLTRGTIRVSALEVAEDFAIIAWERRRVPNPQHYATGRGVVTLYHLRVSNASGVHMESFLGDGDCPYRIRNLEPDTYYCVELKAQYNDEEWGLWSTPLWCLTMQILKVHTRNITEEFCTLSISQPALQRRLPEDDGHRTAADRLVSFGEFRPHLLLCVTTPFVTKTPHTASGVSKPKHHNSSLPPNAAEHRFVYQMELNSTSDVTEHTVPHLKPNTVYYVSARSKLANGEWGMWSPSTIFATVPTPCVTFSDIGENFLSVEWKRPVQALPASLETPMDVVLGHCVINTSQVRLRQAGGKHSVVRTVDGAATTLRMDGLTPSTTYEVAVRTSTGSDEWGMWSEERKARTVPAMHIHVRYASEDAVWASWWRNSDLDAVYDVDTVVNANVVAHSYEVCITGAGGFRYMKEMDTNRLFFRGLQPDAVYVVHVRVLIRETEEWGQWSTTAFRTQARLRVTFGSIGEHFAIVEWRRHLPKPSGPDTGVTGPVAEFEDVVQEFRLKVQRVDDPTPSTYDLNYNVSNFKLRNLKPSAEYCVWLCAKGFEGVWGYWNEEARVRTLPKLQLEVLHIGEDSVRVSWTRAAWRHTTPEASGAEVLQVEGAVSGYRVQVLNRDGEVVLSQSVGHSEKECVLSQLELFSLYTVQVSAKDTYNEWGLWSDPKQFVTLKPVLVRPLTIGETFADVEWSRQGHGHSSCISSGDRSSSSDAANASNASPVPETIRSGSEGICWQPSDEDTVSGDDNEGMEELESDGQQFSEKHIPVDAIRGDETVVQWHVRVHGQCVDGSVPGTDSPFEFFTEAHVCRRMIEMLHPNSTYFIAVRGKNTGGDWGHWSPSVCVTTVPLLSVRMGAVGETFMSLSWERPAISTSPGGPFVCIPCPTAVHNYQVTIKPLAAETPFLEEDEPLVDGARVYETTQPSLRLGNLCPGTRYTVVVCEQLIGTDGRAVEDSWGASSEAKFVETVQPLRVFPLEIGEDYCLVEWRRTQRPPENDSVLCVGKCLSAPTEFELHTQRLDNDAVTVYTGHLAMDSVLSLSPSSQKYLIGDLCHCTMYVVRVRARGDAGLWGPWSPLTKFVTQSRLQLTVHDVLEHTVHISWARPPPEWARPLSRNDAQREPGQRKLEAEGERGELLPSPLRDIVIGDDGITQYEVSIVGLSCSFSQHLHFSRNDMFAYIEGLQQNHLYAIAVRSLSETQHWSMFSNRESVLTLAPMQVEVMHYTECRAQLRWFRSPPDVGPFAELLHKARVEAERVCDERERRELFEMKRRAQEMPDNDEAAPGCIDAQARLERNDVLRREAIHHYLIPNVVLGRLDVTGFHLQVFGEPGCVRLEGLERLRLPADEPQKKHGSQRWHGKQRHADSTDDPSHDCGDTPAKGLSSFGSVLIDAPLLGEVRDVVLSGLRPGSPYTVRVCSRSPHGAWQSWSVPCRLVTLPAFVLGQSRFGEHYISLYWHRMSEATAAELEENAERYDALNSTLNAMSPTSLESIKRDHSEEAYHTLIGTLTDTHEAKQRVTEDFQRLADGEGEVLVDAKTPIVGYHVRIVHENGGYQDHYLPRDKPGETAYTLTGLAPNHRYVCLLCAEYAGGFWGLWASPLKFMTQNVLQLQVVYMSESFVDIEWYRMDNKALPEADRGDTMKSDTVSSERHVYQVHIQSEDPTTGALSEEYRDMKACSAFRVDGLLPDTKYTIAVREWDAKGDWGLWCTPRTCVTLPGMLVSHEDIGENWATVSWKRQEKRGDYDNDMRVLQYGVEAISYFLRVEELSETEEDAHGEARDPTARQELDGPPNSLDDILGSLQPTTVPREQGPLPPHEQPVEFDGIVNNRYCLVKHFDVSTLTYRVDNLRPNRFYSVQVLSETTGGQLGLWSAKSYMLTTSRVEVTPKYIDEQYIDISWGRAPVRQHPLIGKAPVFVSDAVPTAFELETAGVSEAAVTTLLTLTERSYRLKGLLPDHLYTARVRCIDDKKHTSMWSYTLSVVTLKPVVVTPTQITEESIFLTWGREEQNPHDYAVEDGSGPVLFGSRVLSSSLVRVTLAASAPRQVAFEKNFTAGVQQVVVSSLAPNTAYMVTARPSNDRGECGIWSNGRCIYTMKLLRTVVSAAGEDYLRIAWQRDAPDEVPQPQVADPESSQSAEEIATPTPNADGDAAVPSVSTDPNRKLSLLDQPEGSPVVYNSALTVVRAFEISVRCEGDAEDNVFELPGKLSSWTLPDLKPDAVYTVCVRVCYGDGKPGPWSETVRSGTYNLIAVTVLGAGEDYLTASWQRMSVTADTNTLQLGEVEETVAYEFAVHDFTDVRFGEEKSVKLDERLHSTSFVVPTQRHYSVKDLKPHHRYSVAVRRWFRPLVPCPARPPAEYASADEALTEILCSSGAVPGLWSEAELAVTLREMVCSVEAITETSFRMQWERDQRAAPLPVHKPLATRPPQSYHIRIDEPLPDGSGPRDDSDAYHVDQPMGPDDTCFVADHLIPDTVYRVVVRCCIDSVWGKWSAPVYVITLPQLVAEVTDICEDGALISWQRHCRELELPDGTRAVIGDATAMEAYQLEVNGVSYDYKVGKVIKGTRATYMVRHLEADMLYSISVRSRENDHDEWSLWSHVVHFATLKPLRLQLGLIGEHFVHVEWHREEQHVDEYETLAGGPVLLGNTDVAAYHLCLFSTETTPTLAVLDKQFHKDVNCYRISGLAPDTPYVAIVRACTANSRWGLWSEERPLRTQRVLSLHLDRCGEQYAVLKWERTEGDRGESGATPVGYQLVLRRGGESTFEKTLLPEDCEVTADAFHLPCYRLDSLLPGTNYVAALQPRYSDEDWGMWSTTVSFTTLSALTLTTTGVWTDHVELMWARADLFAMSEAVKSPPLDATAREEQPTVTTGNDVVAEGSPSRPLELNVKMYHLVIFDSEPRTSFVDGEEVPAVDGAMVSHEEAAAITGDDSAETTSSLLLVDRPATSHVDLCMEVCQPTDARGNYLMDQLQPDHVYVARVRAMDVHGVWGAWSEYTVNTPPLAPTGVVLRQVNAQYCSLQWSAPEGSCVPYRYVVEQCYVTPAGPAGSHAGQRRKSVVAAVQDWQVVDVVEDMVCAIRIQGALPRLRCRVKCARRGGAHPYGSFSEVVALSAGTPPEPISGLAVVLLSCSSAVLEWVPTRKTAAPGARAVRLMYRVYLGVRDQPTMLVATTNLLSCTLNELQPATEYHVQIVAENKDGMSFNNPMIRFMTKSGEDEVSRFEAGQPPLGSLVDAHPAIRDGQEPAQIPVAAELRKSGRSTTFVPTAPSGARPKSTRLPSLNHQKKKSSARGTGSSLLPSASGRLLAGMDDRVGLMTHPPPGKRAESRRGRPAAGRSSSRDNRGASLRLAKGSRPSKGGQLPPL